MLDYLRTYKKSQISILFISIISILLIVTMVTVNIGKIAKDKTYTANSADAGAIAGASVMAYAFNYAANANKDESEKLKGNWNRFKDTATQHFDHARDRIYGVGNQAGTYTKASNDAKQQSCCFGVAISASLYAWQASRHADRYQRQMNELIKGAWPSASSSEDQRGQDLGVIPNYAHLQESYYKAIRERVQDDSKNSSDLYQQALSTACKYNFYNSGFPVKMGEDSKEFFEQVDQYCDPGAVSSGQSMSYTWTDKAGRSHTVTAMVSIQDAKTYKVKKTGMDRAQVQSNLEQAKTHAINARGIAEMAAKHYPTAMACLGCTPSTPPCCPGIKAQGDSLMRQADQEMREANRLAEEVRRGILEDGEKTSTSKDDTSDIIIKYLNDIQHDRSVSSMQYQKHMGGVVKSPRAEIDTPTFYPPVQSSATASFRGNGNIGSAQPKHDVSLTSAN